MNEKKAPEDKKDLSIPVEPYPDAEVPEKPSKERKPRKDKGQKRGAKKTTEIKTIPLKISFQIIADALANATAKPAFKMSEQEAGNCEHGVNEFVKYKFEDIEKYYPYIMLVTPFVAYFGRVAIEISKQEADKITKREPVNESPCAKKAREEAEKLEKQGKVEEDKDVVDFRKRQKVNK